MLYNVITTFVKIKMSGIEATYHAVLAASEAYKQSTQPPAVKAQMFYTAIKNYPDIGAVVTKVRSYGLPVPTDAELNQIHAQDQATVNYFSNRPQPAQPAQRLVGSLEQQSGLASIASAMRANPPEAWNQRDPNAMDYNGGKSRRKGRKGRKGRRKGRKSRKH